MVYSLVGFEAGGWWGGGQVQRNKRDLKISAEGGVSPYWEGGGVPHPTWPPLEKMLGSAWAHSKEPLHLAVDLLLHWAHPWPSEAKWALEARQKAAL